MAWYYMMWLRLRYLHQLDPGDLPFTEACTIFAPFLVEPTELVRETMNGILAALRHFWALDSVRKGDQASSGIMSHLGQSYMDTLMVINGD